MTAALPLPQAHAVERELLGCLFLDPSLLDAVSAELESDAFHAPRHRLVYDALRSVHERGARVELPVVRQELERAGAWERVGDAGLGAILDCQGTTLSWREHVRVLQRCAEQRRMIDAARDIEASAFAPRCDDQDDLVARAEERLRAVAMAPARTGLRPLSGAVQDAVDGWEAQAAEDAPPGLPTGMSDLDKLTGGYRPGDLVIVAARPAMGKTALALGWAVHHGRQGKRVAVFSLEMPAMQLAARLIASEARIDLARLRAAKVRADEWPQLGDAAERLTRLPVLVDDAGSLTVDQIASAVRREHRAHGLDVVFVDYLQRVRVDRSRSREEEVAQVVMRLKTLAKELNVPVVALAQLNRKCEERSDKRPLLADLRDSGQVEQEADMVVGLYRHEVYVPGSNRGEAELHVLKHRNGPTGVVKLRFDGAFTRFTGLAPQEDWTCR